MFYFLTYILFLFFVSVSLQFLLCVLWLFAYLPAAIFPDLGSLFLRAFEFPERKRGKHSFLGRYLEQLCLCRGGKKEILKGFINR